MINIVYEDSEIIVCEKPLGYTSQADSKGGKNMVDELAEHLSDNGEKGSIYVVHRLDKNVGGLMVFCKKNTVAAKLSTAIQERNFTKEYMAVVNGCPDEKEAVLKDLLFKDSSKNKSFVVKRMRKGVKEASLDYTCIDTADNAGNNVSLLRIKLHTGRTHQIRVQFASRKMSLLGDGKYGSRDNKCEVALWSYRLAFKHPATHKDMDFTSEPPMQYPWNLFAKTS